VQILLLMVLQATMQAPQQPDIEHIRARMFERLAIDSKRQIQGASWIKERTDEDISNPLKSKVEHRERYQVWGDGAQVLQRKILRDGESVIEKSKLLPFFLEPALLARFEFFLIEPAEVLCGEHKCWHLSFAPKPNQTDESDDMERKMFSTSVGTVLVDSKSYTIARVEGHIATPFRSLLYDVYWTKVTITQEMHKGTMVVSTIEMSFQRRILFTTKTKRRFYRTVDVVFPPS